MLTSELKLDFFHNLSWEEIPERINKGFEKGLKEKFGGKLSGFYGHWDSHNDPKESVYRFGFRVPGSTLYGHGRTAKKLLFTGRLVVKPGRRLTIFLELPDPTTIGKVMGIHEVVLGVREVMDKLLV